MFVFVVCCSSRRRFDLVSLWSRSIRHFGARVPSILLLIRLEPVTVEQNLKNETEKTGFYFYF